jgi:ribosomal protein L16/L10AE
MIIPVTKKPLEARLGGGKADRSYWECPIKKGMIILEIGGDISFTELSIGLKKVCDKLPFKSNIISMYY